jgi:GNAT superfamily N-acetyltransferase
VSLRIRQAGPEDCQAVASLVQQYWRFEQIDGFDRDRIIHLLQGFVARPEQGCCWVADHGGELRAYLLASYLFSLEFGGTIAEVDELFVLEPHRGAGLAAALLQRAVTQMQQAQIMALQLELGLHNQVARTFYRRHGFIERSDYELLVKTLDPCGEMRTGHQNA